MKVLRDESGALPIKLIIIVLLVAVLGGGGFMMLKKHKKGKVAPKKIELSAMKLDEFMVNLADQNESRYIKVDMVLEVEGAPKSSGEGDGKDVSPEDAKVRDTCIGVLSSKRFSELLTEKGKEDLKTQLKDQINKNLQDDKIVVHNIYFTSFAMQ